MQVWRICSKRRSRAAFQGEGARLYGGRWNPPGVSVVYTSGSLALAALEMFVNLDPQDMPQDLVSIAVTIPDGVQTESVAIGDLPAGWERAPAPEYLQLLGADWVRRRNTAVLSVPSAVIPSERNFLLNPAHRDFKRIKTGKPEAFRFDPRVWK